MNEILEQYKKSDLKSWLKVFIAFAAAIGMIIATIMGAMAYTLDDNEDIIHLNRGDTIEGVFMIDNFEQETTLISNMEWISLDENEYISEKKAEGINFIDNSYAFYYWVTVPDDADIGIYRGTIQIIAPSGTKYLNIKMSVQNGAVTGLVRMWRNPASKVAAIVGLSIIILVIFLLSFRGAKNSGKR